MLVAAALLLEAVFAIQYVNMRARLSETMEHRVLSEMRIEALYIKRFLRPRGILTNTNHRSLCEAESNRPNIPNVGLAADEEFVAAR